MSVLRQANLLGQQRIDVPHIRAIESSICGDFDLLAGKVLAGSGALVVQGFEVITTGAIGAAATALQINTASGILLHPLASESGTIFSVPDDRDVEVLGSSNSRLDGSFTANTVNYVGIDLRRSPDSTTADLVQFLDPNTDSETPTSVPLGRTLDYVIVVSTQDFATTPGVCPIAKVTTDSNNLVLSIEDARQMMWRLGSGGSIPDIYGTYSWPGGRSESTDNDAFGEGDKAIASMKDWVNAAMTRIWELGGGEHWFSSTADRNVKLCRTGATFTNGEWFEWDGTNLHWKGLKFVFENSTASYNDIDDQTSDSTGLTNLADGECIYVDVDRTTDRTGVTALQGVKAPFATLGDPTVPGSRYIIAWRVGSTVFTRDSSFPVGATFQAATTTSLGLVELTYAAGTPSTPKVAPQDANGSILNEAFAGQFPGFIGTGGTNVGDVDSGSIIYGNDGVVGIGGAGGATHQAGSGLRGKGGASGGAGGGHGVSGLGVGSGSGVKGTGGTTGAAIWCDGFTELTQIAPGSAPAAPSSGYARVYLTHNNVASPNRRDQLVVKWSDGLVTIIAESDLY